MYLDESKPTSYARQIAQTRKSFYSKIAERKVIDRPIDLRRRTHEQPKIDDSTPLFWDLLSEWNIHIPSIRSNSHHLAPTSYNPLSSGFKVKEIQRAVCRVYDISHSDLISSRRTGGVVEPRHIAIMMCKHLTRLSLPEIGRLFGGKDHTTILHAVRRLRLVLMEVLGIVPFDASPDMWAQTSKEVFAKLGMRTGKARVDSYGV